jgi:hypothetical protein
MDSRGSELFTATTVGTAAATTTTTTITTTTTATTTTTITFPLLCASSSSQTSPSHVCLPKDALGFRLIPLINFCFHHYLSYSWVFFFVS